MAKRAVNTPKRAEAYRHDEQAVVRREGETRSQFKKRREHKRYRHNDSLSPSLDWDSQNPVREFGEWLVAQIDEASQLDPPHRFDSPR